MVPHYHQMDEVNQSTPVFPRILIIGLTKSLCRPWYNVASETIMWLQQTITSFSRSLDADSVGTLGKNSKWETVLIWGHLMIARMHQYHWIGSMDKVGKLIPYYLGLSLCHSGMICLQTEIISDDSRCISELWSYLEKICSDACNTWSHTGHDSDSECFHN